MADYYDVHHRDFEAGTADLDMNDLYAPFLAIVPQGGFILDAGCGVGRDSKHFISMGYTVTAFDASVAMCRIASERAGIPLQQLRFQDIEWHDHFDGIWACASLLHVPASELLGVLQRLCRALHPGGCLFASFKLGHGERIAADRRCFTDQTMETLAALVRACTTLRMVRIWETSDVRIDRSDERWVCVIATDTRQGHSIDHLR